MAVNGTKAAILFGDGQPASYRMFDAQDLTTEGVFLSGTLLLEVDEEFDVELRFDDDSSLTVRARVLDVAPGGDEPGMSVSFPSLGEDERKRLQTKLRNNHG